MTDPIAVLVVEDDPLIRMDIVDQLDGDGFKVFEAENADFAIVLMSTHAEIRVVLTDIDMPGSMDGLKLANYVRNRWPPIKIIVTSGRAPPLEGLPEGAAFFPKPYPHADVLRSIRSMLSL
jgi:CheY-like chemotaxis protein